MFIRYCTTTEPVSANRTLGFLMVLLVTGFLVSPESLSASEFKQSAYILTPDVVYGQADVKTEDGIKPRALWMDVYQPAASEKKDRPAVIMTFGGSFHRGGPRYRFRLDGVRDDSMGDYCRRLAEQGYVCFAIDYRLAPENPVPARQGYGDNDLDLTAIRYMLPHVNKIRLQMQLAPFDPNNERDVDTMLAAVLAAAEDLRQAIRHIRAHADRYGIDPQRLALGGFSAGAITSMNVAHGLKEPVAGVFSLSGGYAGFHIADRLTRDSAEVLWFVGENDLPGIRKFLPVLLSIYEKTGVPHELVWVPGFGHFYPAAVPSLSADGRKLSVDARIVEFLQRVIGKE